MRLQPANERLSQRNELVMKKAFFAIGILIVALAVWAPLTERFYPLDFKKTSQPVHIALLSDVHSGTFYLPELFAKLQEAKDKEQLDAIFLVGDIIDDKEPIEGAVALLSRLQNDFAQTPKFYVTGNHEFMGDIDTYKKLVRDNGIVILDSQLPSVSIELKGRKLWLFGIDDPKGFDNDVVYWKSLLRTTLTDTHSWQIAKNSELPEWFGAIATPASDTALKILLTHRPEFIEEYLQFPLDIIVSGHTHGGQVRIPFLVNGLYAPNQGLFSPYAGGVYEFDKLAEQPHSDSPLYLVVSRGMSLNWKVPRIFNPPELIWLTIE